MFNKNYLNRIMNKILRKSFNKLGCYDEFDTNFKKGQMY